jgi:hypothetical protein
MSHLCQVVEDDTRLRSTCDVRAEVSELVQALIRHHAQQLQLAPVLLAPTAREDGRAASLLFIGTRRS